MTWGSEQHSGCHRRASPGEVSRCVAVLCPARRQGRDWVQRMDMRTKAPEAAKEAKDESGEEGRVLDQCCHLGRQVTWRECEGLKQARGTFTLPFGKVPPWHGGGRTGRVEGTRRAAGRMLPQSKQEMVRAWARAEPQGEPKGGALGCGRGRSC